ncbi:MAG TPA: hypothetical protein VFQ68_25755 [Streptosporangiaceae bacterium]|nr:hypothetical protein [Streptosporangiaceae bacterium]
MPDIEPDDGDGPGGDGRGCHEEPEPPGRAGQVTGTTCVSASSPGGQLRVEGLSCPTK